MDRLWGDIRVSVRHLRRSPGFTLSAVSILTLCIGANAAIFGVVDCYVWRSLPVERPSQLVFLNYKASSELPTQSYPNYRDLRDHDGNVLDGLIAYAPAPASLSRGGNNARVWGYLVTGNYFDVLGIQAIRGRALRPEDDLRPGGHPVAVLSYAAWKNRFAGDPEIVGSMVKLNGLDYSVVGVMPSGFFGTELLYTPDIFVPMMMQAQIQPGDPWLESRSSQNIFVVGRLKEGVTRPQAGEALNALAAGLGREYPDVDAGMQIALTSVGLFGNFVGPITGGSAVLMTMVGLVLLVGCVNLAGLLLARASDRQRETAIRLALGARRITLIRELLVESLTLSLLGGAGALLLAAWLLDALNTWKPPVDVPIGADLALDWRLSLFTAAASLITGILIGLVPALQSTREAIAPALKQQTGRWHLRDILVTTQIALSVIAVVGSLLVVRSFRNALDARLGFDPDHAVMTSFDLGLQGYSREQAAEFQKRLIEKVRALPGVESAALAEELPLSLAQSNNRISIEGRPEVIPAEMPMIATYLAGPGFFHTMRTRLIAGREFEDRDPNGRYVIVNQAFAQQLFPGEDAMGKRIRLGSMPWREIAGIVEDGKYRWLGESPLAVMFLPFAESNLVTTVVARSPLSESEMAALLRATVLGMDSTIPLYHTRPLSEHLEWPLFPARFIAGTLGAFGGLAILLAAAGVYGIMAYAVARRTREIGIRMALGAAPGQVVRDVITRASWLVGTGTVLGIAGALAVGKLFAQVLYGVSPYDPLVLTLAVLFMGLVAVGACWIPARRATRIDPLTALRAD